jgi:hypothetical protein
MADTLALLFVAVSLLVLFRQHFFKTEGGSFFLLFFLGCLTFFKHIFRVFSLPLALLILIRQIMRAHLRQALLGLCLFSAGPLLYGVFFALPNFGTLNYEHFSGYSLFANILPLATCKDLSASFPRAHAGSSAEPRCDADLISPANWQQLWLKGGIIHAAENDFALKPLSVEANRFFKAWAYRLIWIKPSVALGAIKENMKGYFSFEVPGAIRFLTEPSLDHCEMVYHDFFNVTPNQYATSLRAFLDSHREGLETLDLVASYFTGISRITLWTLCLCALIALTIRRRIDFKIIILLSLGILYGSAVFLGGYTEARAYVPLDYILWLAVAFSVQTIFMEKADGDRSHSFESAK